jgi:hypothetical protein
MSLQSDAQYNVEISPGSPPLKWSDLKEAFDKVNLNFEILAASIGESGFELINFNNLNTGLSPSSTNQFGLGTPIKSWKHLYISSFADIPGSELNGLWLGSAQIKNISNTVELPENSTVAGNLIIDPDKTFFKTVKITGDRGGDIVASKFNDDLKLNSGSGIEISVDSAGESIIVDNIGIITVSAGAGINATGTDPLIITNTGVLSVSPVQPLPTGLPPGTGISVTQTTGNTVITNTGVVGLTNGFGINITRDPATGISDISFNAGVAPQAAFIAIQVPGQNPLLADSVSDILLIEASAPLTITTSEPIGGNATISFAFDNKTDIIGSIFADNSTLLVDGTSGNIVGPVDNLSISTDFINMRGDINLSLNNIDNVDTLNVVTINADLLNIVSINSDQISSREFVGDVKGSVFADNSTLLVDAVNGSIPYTVLTGAPSALSEFSNDLDYAGIVGITIQNNGLPVNTFLTGDLNAQNHNISNANLVNASGDFRGSVFADNSTLLIDGINGVIFAENLTGTFTGNVIGNTTGYHIGDVTGSIFADNSTLLVDAVNGIIPGYISIQELKTLVSSSATYGDFQTAIAAL